MENKEEIIFIRKYGLFTTIWIFFIVALLIVDPILVSMDFQDPIKSVLKIGIYIYILFMLIYSILIGFSTFLKFNKKERFQTRNFIFLILGLLMFLFPIVILAGICLAGGDLFFMSYIPDVVEPVESSGSEYDVISAFLLEDYYVNSIITLSVSFLLLFFGGITILFFINTFDRRLTQFTEYVFSKELREKYNEQIKSYRDRIYIILFLMLILILAFLSIFRISLQVVGLIFAILAFFGLGIYNGICVNFAYRLYDKIEINFEGLNHDVGKLETSKASRKKTIFKEVHSQIGAADSYLWAFLVIMIPIALWWYVGLSIFGLNVQFFITMTSISLLLALIGPYQYINTLIKKKAVSYLIEHDLSEYLSGLKEVMGFRNAVISFLIPLAGVISVILSYTMK